MVQIDYGSRCLENDGFSYLWSQRYSVDDRGSGRGHGVIATVLKDGKEYTINLAELVLEDDTKSGK